MLYGADSLATDDMISTGHPGTALRTSPGWYCLSRLGMGMASRINQLLILNCLIFLPSRTSPERRAEDQENRQRAQCHESPSLDRGHRRLDFARLDGQR